MKVDAVLFMQLLHESAELRAQHALERQRGRWLTTSTSRLRARSDAATSRPMKLEPTTTARRAVFAAAMMPRASAKRAQREDVRECRALDRQTHRLRAHREQQRIVGKSAAAPEH